MDHSGLQELKNLPSERIEKGEIPDDMPSRKVYELEEIFHSPRQFRPNLRNMRKDVRATPICPIWRSRLCPWSREPSQGNYWKARRDASRAMSDLRAGRAVGVRNFANSFCHPLGMQRNFVCVFCLSLNRINYTYSTIWHSPSSVVQTAY